MDFTEIFKEFLDRKANLKVVFVASSDWLGNPNCSPKMLIDVSPPNLIYYIDFKFSSTYQNISSNPNISLSFMDDKYFTGFRLKGHSEFLEHGKEFDKIKKVWDQRVVSYETSRMIERIKGIFSTRQSEITIPANFVITRFMAEEAAAVKPDRVLKTPRNPAEKIEQHINPVRARMIALEETDKKHQKKEERLSKSLDFLKNTIDAITDPVTVINRKFEVISANHAVLQNRLHESSCRGKRLNCYDLYPPGKNHCQGNRHLCPLAKAFETKKPQTVLHRHFSADGKEIFTEVCASPVLNESGEVFQIVETCHDVTEHVLAAKKVEKEKKFFEEKSIHDELTGLYNRRGFMELVQRQILLSKRTGARHFILFSDLDALKPINDRYGHPVGDQAILEAADVLKETFRESDIIARVGGDEFAVAILDYPYDETESLQRRLDKKVSTHNALSGRLYPLSLSVGITPCEADSPEQLEQVLGRADRLMYDQKLSKKEHPPRTGYNPKL